MSWLTQTQRFLQLDSITSNDTSLVLTHFSGIEKLSDPFQFSLAMVSENTNIQPADMAGQTRHGHHQCQRD